ncbi:MAG: SagB/ThcOx family dehydrogenase [Sedimentisphaerales bacterium]|nr:SagB/ThcOx family dehydrogenase [Sedimentisphaerales bacterium]
MSRILKLPQPDTKGSVPLERVILQRRSRRDYLPDALTPEQVGQLCWAAQGRIGRFRTTPSAGATYPLELFVMSADGLFHYLPDKHSLEELTTEDLRGKLAAAAWGQGFIGQAGATLMLAAEFARTTSRYGERGIRYVYMEAGHAAQNIHLQAEALGLGSVAVGAFDDAAISRVLLLPGNLEPLYMVVVGRYRGDAMR